MDISDDEFTFCQVASPVDQDGPEGRKLVSDISGISIRDAPSKSDINGDIPNGNFPWNVKAEDNPISAKQATVGSLSFNVVDASSAKNVTNFFKEPSSGAAGSSVGNSKEQKPVARKAAPRAKVPFEKGYSQMDWLKLTRTHPDLAGLKGQSSRRLISMDEVKQHQTEGSMWTVLKGRVYNISPYMKFHPGGVDILMKAVGRDCTSLFNKYHAWVNAEFLLEKCLVGILDESKK